MRGAPQVGFAREIFLMRAMILGWIVGRPCGLRLERRRLCLPKTHPCKEKGGGEGEEREEREMAGEEGDGREEREMGGRRGRISRKSLGEI